MSLPSSATAGTDISWTQTATVSGATATMVFNHFDTGITFAVEATESGGLWSFALDPVKTASAPTGQYSTALIIESSTGRTQTNGSAFKLNPAIDRELEESHAAKMVRLLERHLEGRIDDAEGRGLETYDIAGTPITKISHLDARKLLTEYRSDLRAEQDKRRRDMGLKSNRIIKIEF